MNLHEKIGQMLMTGFPSTELTPEFIRLVEEYKVGNVILFSANIESVVQLKRLCGEIQELVQRNTGHPALIAVDQEGGVVTRMPADAANVPGAMALSATGKPDFAYEAGKLTGEELRYCGVNFDLAPDVDVNSNPDNPVIGVRSYGDSPETVIRYSLEMMRGLQEGGVLCAVKHFPGHGDTSVDSHVGLPVVDKSLSELEQMELRPFAAAIAAGADAVMTTHILFPQLEPESLPATMSKTILTGLLREKMGFQGLVITDCLEMGAIKQKYGTPAGACLAVKAGADILCISHTPELVTEAAERIYASLDAGEIPESRIDEAVGHILTCKRKVADRPAPHRIDFEAHRRVVQQMVRESLTLVRGELPPLGGNPLFLGCYAYRSTLASSGPDKQISFPEFLRERLGGESAVTAANPDEEEIRRCVSAASAHSCVVIGTYNGHINRGQIALANRICREATVHVIVITLRNPYDISLIDRRAACIAAYEYSEQSFSALAAVLAGKEILQGKLSIALP